MEAERIEIRRIHDRNIYFCEWKQAAGLMTHRSDWGLADKNEVEGGGGH